MGSGGSANGKKLYAGFTVDFVSATRAINSDSSNRGEVDEIIATNNPVESG